MNMMEMNDMRYIAIEALALIGGCALIAAWFVLADLLFPVSSLGKIAFILAPSVLIVGNLVWSARNSEGK